MGQASQKKWQSRARMEKRYPVSMTITEWFNDQWRPGREEKEVKLDLKECLYSICFNIYEMCKKNVWFILYGFGCTMKPCKLVQNGNFEKM
jgi:hypothetical protein